MDMQSPIETRWRVPAAHIVIKAVAAAVLAGLAALNTEDTGLILLAGAAALGAAALALRDVLAPARVTADATGLVLVTGFAGRTALRWADVAAIRVDESSRFGLRARLLEIETTAGDLHLFSRYDLGAEPADVRDALDDLRTLP